MAETSLIQSVGYRGGGVWAFTHHVIGSVRSVWRTQDDSLAGLTFGQWVHLLPKPHAGERNARVILWNEALEPNLSPYGRSSSSRRRFQSQALAVKELRNQATHRRPLVKDKNRIQNAHRDCIELLRAINPELGGWFKNQKWIPNVLATSPIPRK